MDPHRAATDDGGPLGPVRSEIPVGVRLPLATEKLPPNQLLGFCRAAVELGYRSLWVGDHVLLPATSRSAYPHTSDGSRPFTADTPWTDPLLTLTWLAAQLGPGVRFGTSIIILTMRNPALLAKQLSTVSWLTGRGFSLGVGSGWLRDEYNAIGVPFERRATRARQMIAEMRELLTTGRREYEVVDEESATGVTRKPFLMLPLAPGRVEFLWGGFSPAALRLVAGSCDGWLPAKQSVDALRGHLTRLRAACDEAGRDFAELRLVVKPGSGPDPRSGAIDERSLHDYATLGFGEAILEMPYEPDGLDDAIGVLERVARRSWR